MLNNLVSFVKKCILGIFQEKEVVEKTDWFFKLLYIKSGKIFLKRLIIISRFFPLPNKKNSL